MNVYTSISIAIYHIMLTVNFRSYKKYKIRKHIVILTSLNYQGLANYQYVCTLHNSVAIAS